MIIRFFDIFLSLIGLVLFLPIMVFVFFVSYFMTGPPLFFQERVGKNEELFWLIKFRTMKIGTEETPTHLIEPTRITSFGYFLRRTKLDELPQLFNVLRGEMSLVGPRPCLPLQNELRLERRKYHVYQVKPGITGLSQITGIDMSRPSLLAKTDAVMLNEMSLHMYFKIIFKTILGKGFGDNIRFK